MRVGEVWKNKHGEMALVKGYITGAHYDMATLYSIMPSSCAIYVTGHPEEWEKVSEKLEDYMTVDDRAYKVCKILRELAEAIIRTK